MGLVCAVVGCGSDSDSDSEDTTPTIDVSAACGRISDALCNKLVQCKAILSGVHITAQFCQQSRQQLVDTCASKAQHTTATDADVASCESGFQNFACTDLCNKVPQDPPACDKISGGDPNTETYTCDP